MVGALKCELALLRRKVFVQFSQQLAELRARPAALKEQITELDTVVQGLEPELNSILLTIPLPPDPDVPVGSSAADNIEVRRWSTKRRGLLLIHAARVPDKRAAAWKHVPPELVGNRRQVLVSDQAGKSNLIAALQQRLDVVDQGHEAVLAHQHGRHRLGAVGHGGNRGDVHVAI